MSQACQSMVTILDDSDGEGANKRCMAGQEDHPGRHWATGNDSEYDYEIQWGEES